jgi:hypothetical protein
MSRAGVFFAGISESDDEFHNREYTVKYIN